MNKERDDNTSVITPNILCQSACNVMPLGKTIAH